MSEYKIGINDAIVITKSAGLSGAHTLLEKKYETIYSRLTKDFLASVYEYDQMFSVAQEYEVLKQHPFDVAVEAAFGGVYGALFQLGYQSGLGFRVDLKKIPIEQKVIEIAECFGINPYLLHSKGCMVIATPAGELLCDELQKAGIPAVVVGRMTKEKGRIVYLEEEERFLTPARRDALLECIEAEALPKFNKNLKIVSSEEICK